MLRFIVMKKLICIHFAIYLEPSFLPENCLNLAYLTLFDSSIKEPSHHATAKFLMMKACICNVYFCIVVAVYRVLFCLVCPAESASFIHYNHKQG